MAIYLRGATDPDALRDRIVKAVRTDLKIETWNVDKDEMLIHTPSNWPEKGRFKVTVNGSGEVTFGIHDWKAGAYQYLHGRLLELLLGHFAGEYKDIRVVDSRE